MSSVDIQSWQVCARWTENRLARIASSPSTHVDVTSGAVDLREPTAHGEDDTARSRSTAGLLFPSSITCHMALHSATLQWFRTMPFRS